MITTKQYNNMSSTIQACASPSLQVNLDSVILVVINLLLPLLVSRGPLLPPVVDEGSFSPDRRRRHVDALDVGARDLEHGVQQQVLL